MSQQVKRLTELQKRDRNLRFRTDEQLQVVRHLRGDLDRIEVADEKKVRTRAIAFVKQNQALFGNVRAEAMQVIANATDPDGGRDLVLQQFHGPHLVYGGSMRLHVRKDGMLDTVSNSLFPDLEAVPVEARISEARAIKIAQQATRTENGRVEKPELIVYRHEGTARLVYKVTIDDPTPGDRGRPARWIVMVDATSGKVLVQYDDVKTIGPIVAQGTGYYSGPGTVNAWDNGATFQLRDTTRGAPEIITNDEDGASPSEDTDQNWNDTTIVPRHAHQGPEVDAHRFAGTVIDYFNLVHGRNSYNGAGANINITTHVGVDYSNGYWHPGLQRVFLGDGSGDPATGDDYECSDDWLAHELTHAYTQFTCGLQYLNESGALNEAFSDVFAAFITNDWLVFEDTWIKPSAPAWRNMVDPTNGGAYNTLDPIGSVLAGHQPSHMSQKYTGGADSGGVHINSGIINNLFYLLTVGGTHTISGIAVSGIGKAAAEQMLFRCMTVNLVGKPNATFLDFREAMLDACLDLFPTDLNKLTQVKNAFNAVGIGPDLYVRDNLADTGLEPFGGSYLWASPDIINRQTASMSPAVDFADLTNDALWQNIEKGQPNFVYVRVQNRGPQQGDASVNVYLVPATSFGNPAGWIHVGTSAPLLAIAPATMRIAEVTLPNALIPGPGHYCMVAVITSSLDPAPDHTLIASVSDYLHFVRNTNNIAYRNMDVVDLVPGTPGVIEIDVHGFGARGEYSLKLDTGRLPAGMQVRLRAPLPALRGADLRGMKIVDRSKNDVVYELAAGRELRRQFDFVRGRVAVPIIDGLLVEKPFKLRIEYELPKQFAGEARGGELQIRQIYKGEDIGAFGIRFRLARGFKEVDRIIDAPGDTRIDVSTPKDIPVTPPLVIRSKKRS